MIFKGVNYWSFPGGLEGSYSPIKAIDKAKELGFEAIELCIGETGALSLHATEKRCEELRFHADRKEIKLASVASGLYWSRALGDAESAARSQAVDDLTKMIRITAWLGAKTLLTIPGAVDVFFLPDRPALSYDAVLEHAKKGLRRVLRVAEKAGVRLGIENVWNRFLLSPTEMADFIDSFDSPFIGSYFDVGNVLPFGYPEHWLRILGKRVVGVHFKDFRRAVGTAEGFVDLLEGDVNWPEVVLAIQDIGFDGPVVAELIPGYKHHPMVRVANASRAMDAILGRSQ